MRTRLAVAVLLVTSLACPAQVPVLQWGHAFTGAGNLSNYINSCRAVATDDDGNVYTVGEFANNLDLDPSGAQALVSSTGQTDFDIFLASYDTDGQYLWSKQLVTSSLCYASRIAVQPQGDLIIAGYLSGAADMNPDIPVDDITGDGDLFFARYTNAGDLVWAKTFGSVSGVDELHDMKVDDNGNIWIAGAFNDTIDLDPGPNVAQFLCTPASRDGFFVKYDPDGNYLWGHAFGAQWSDEAKAIGFDYQENAIITGYFQISADFDPSAGTNILTSQPGRSRCFMAKYLPNGTLLWATSFGGQFYDVEPMAIATDVIGKINIVGEVYGSDGSLDPTVETGTINTNSNTYGFVAKYTPTGELVWGDVLTCNGSSGPGFTDMVMDSEGGLLVTGFHTNTFDADPGPGNVSLPTSSDDAYLLKYSGSDGAYIWAVGIGGSGSQYMQGLGIDAQNNIYLAGGGNGQFPFNGSEIGGGNNAILMKTGECYPPVIYDQYYPQSDYCDPTSDVLFVVAEGTALNYQWEQNGSPIGTNSDTVAIDPLTAGGYVFTCVIQGACGSDTIQPIEIGVSESPDPVIIEVSGVLHCTAPGASAFQWLLNGVAISGANSAEWTPAENGTYTVWTSNTVCVGVSDPFYYGGIGMAEAPIDPLRVIHVIGTDNATVLAAPTGSTVELFDLTGKRLLKRGTTSEREELPLRGMPEGVYLVKVAERVFRIVR